MSAMKIWRTGKMHFSKLKQYLQTQTSERAKPCDVGQVLAGRGDRGHAE